MSDRGSQGSTPILRRSGPRTVEGFPDWSVEEGFPYRLFYREGEHVAHLDTEMTSSSSGYDIMVYYPSPGTMRWMVPHQETPLGAAKEHQVLARVSAALALLGIRPAWEPFSAQHPRNDWPVIEAEAAALLRRAD